MAKGAAKGYFLTIICGLLLLAATILVLLQWDNTAQFTAYGPWYSVNTALLILASAIGGLVIFWLAKWFAMGIAILYRSRRAERKEREVADAAAARVRPIQSPPVERPAPPPAGRPAPPPPADNPE